jgi:hypothetical protein
MSDRDVSTTFRKIRSRSPCHCQWKAQTLGIRTCTDGCPLDDFTPPTLRTFGVFICRPLPLELLEGYAVILSNRSARIGEDHTSREGTTDRVWLQHTNKWLEYLRVLDVDRQSGSQKRIQRVESDQTNAACRHFWGTYMARAYKYNTQSVHSERSSSSSASVAFFFLTRT